MIEFEIHSQIGHNVGQLRAEVNFVSIPVLVAKGQQGDTVDL
jgi:hypothetical protein